MEDWKYNTARDLGLEASEAMKSIQREVGLPGRLTNSFRHVLAKWYLQAYHHFKVEGSANLPRQLPFILVANHSSHLDALALASVLPMRLNANVFPVAAGDTFFKAPSTALFASFFMNALPIWRRNCGAHTMENLRERMLEEPCGYILFPEGTRSRDGKMGRFKPGIGMLVAGTSVPIVPCHLTGAYDAFPPQDKLPKPRTIRLRVGRPLYFGDIPNGRKGWGDVASTLEKAVRELGVMAK